MKLYDSLTRQKVTFVPIKPGHIGLYVCGITIYDHCHLGHARLMMAFDVMVRFFQAIGYQVTYIRNITDIDDKIIARALTQGCTVQALTDGYIASMHEDMRALGCLNPTHEPRATRSIDDMILLIKTLIDKKHAYVAASGDVCFEVSTLAAYGKLANQNLEQLLEGVRVDVAQDKRSPLDFVLWKSAKPDEPHWSSPWGLGRPGWHIECSAMAMHHLGSTFDIHGGGLDLQFPHHENEIAQSEAATGQPFAHYWLHVGMLQRNHDKMSKSTGNFLTIKSALEAYHPEVLRYFFLSAHYRSPLNFTDEHLHMAERALTRLYQTLRHETMPEEDCLACDASWVERFHDAMQDDFNTPVALSILFEIAHQYHKTLEQRFLVTLKYLGQILGLFSELPSSFLSRGVSQTQRESIEAQLEARHRARQAKDWAKADEIRQALLAEGIEVEDTAQGSVWRFNNEG